MLQLRTLNNYIRFKGYQAELVKGEGYFYLAGEDVAMGQIENMYVCNINHASLSQWQEWIDNALTESKQLLKGN